MEPDAFLSWLALTLTPGIAARFTAAGEFGTPENVFPASLPATRSVSYLPAQRRKLSRGSRPSGARKHLLSQGEQKVVRKGPRERRHHQRIANGLSSRTGELAGRAIASLRECLWVLSLLKVSNIAARELRLDWRWSSAEKFRGTRKRNSGTELRAKPQSSMGQNSSPALSM
jgi:hypothetical protein